MNLADDAFAPRRSACFTISRSASEIPAAGPDATGSVVILWRRKIFGIIISISKNQFVSFVVMCEWISAAGRKALMRTILDRVDRRLAKLLSEDGRDGANGLAERLDLSPPTVRSRLRAMVERNLLKIVGVLNVSERPELVSAIVGISANGHGRLNEIARKISELPFVTSVSIVTGRYDIIAEVLFEGDMDELYRVTSELLPGLEEPGVIRSSETFVVMKSHNKWLSLPKGVWDDEISGDDLAADAGREG